MCLLLTVRQKTLCLEPPHTVRRGDSIFAAYVLPGHPKNLHHGTVTPGSHDIANYETLKADNAALREKVKSTEALLIALQRAYKAKADELESWAQFRLSKEEEADQRQSVVPGSGRCSSHGRRVEF